MKPLATLLLIPTLLAQDKVTTKPSTPALLIQAKALATRLSDDDLRILDTRSPKDYAAGHIPGAVRTDPREWMTLAHEKDGLTNPKPWADLVGKLGIDGKQTVVVYGTSPTNTARVWWTLVYLGCADVRFLDGGWATWKKLELPTDTKPPKVEVAKFTPKLQKHRLASIDEVKASLAEGTLCLIDSRSDAEFTGTRGRGNRLGHIPGAVHLEWKHLIGEDGKFKSPAELRKLFQAAGIAPGKPLVPY